MLVAVGIPLARKIVERVADGAFRRRRPDGPAPQVDRRPNPNIRSLGSRY